MLRSIALPNARSPRGWELRELWQGIVQSAYAKTGLPYCCSPIDMAERLGLQVIRGSITKAILPEGALLYPRQMPHKKLSLLVCFAIAKHLLSLAKMDADERAVSYVTDCLILPSHVAAQVEPDELHSVNPHIPIEVLQRIYRSHEGSGLMPAFIGR